MYMLFKKGILKQSVFKISLNKLLGSSKAGARRRQLDLAELHIERGRRLAVEFRWSVVFDTIKCTCVKMK